MRGRGDRPLRAAGGRRGGPRLMLELLRLMGGSLLPMLIAILLGFLGFVLSFALGILGVYALLTLLGWNLAALPFGGHAFQSYLYALGAAALLRGLLHYIEQFCNHLVAFKTLAELRHRVFAAMQRLAPAKIEGKNPGQLIALIMGDIELLEVFYAHTISPVAIALLCAGALFAFNFSLHWLPALVALLGQLCLGLLYPLIAARKAGGLSLRIRERIGALNGVFLDQLRGLREVLQYGRGPAVLAEMDAVTADLLDRQEALSAQAAALGAWTDGGILFFSLVQALVAALLLRAGQLSLPAALVVSLLTLGSFAPFIALANLGNTLSRTFACAERVLALLEEAPEIAERVDGLEAEPGELAADGLSFRYANEAEPVLEGFSIALREGEMLGLMGGSGSGKSTLLKLFLRFWDPQAGEVRLAGRALPALNTRSIYRQINYMTQNTVLFEGSIRDNLLLAKADADEAALWAALERAALGDFVRALPGGLDAPIGEGGANFSGGERQRLGLARCFLADKPILLLDEPSSNLDSINEALILKSLSADRGSRSVLLVSHRASTLAVCERIVRMEEE